MPANLSVVLILRILFSVGDHCAAVVRNEDPAKGSEAMVVVAPDLKL